MSKTLNRKNFRTPYGGEPAPETGIDFHDSPSLTKQADMESCDVNNILKNFERTGQLPDMIKRDPVYGDFSSVTDYQESLNIVMHAQEQFAGLSAQVRARFANDPEAFLAFASDPRNNEEMVTLGLATKSAVQPSGSVKTPPEDPNEDTGSPVPQSDPNKGPKAPR